MRIKNFYRIITSNILILLVFSSLLHAGTTGKIVGTIIDKTTGEPLPGVNIMLEGYPYLEYGMVQGFISSKSLVPREDYYILDVELPEGLSTFYGEQLKFSQNMSDNAEIITEEIRLIERLINPFKYLINKNKSIGKEIVN